MRNVIKKRGVLAGCGGTPYNPCTWETQAERLQVQDQYGAGYRDTVLQETKGKREDGVLWVGRGQLDLRKRGGGVQENERNEGREN